MEYALLSAIAAIAGFIDAIAGGGGLLILPAILAAGIPPVAALATNKLQSACGTASACVTYARSGHVQLRGFVLPILGAFIGGTCGAIVVQHVGAALLAAFVPLLLIGIAIYVYFSPTMSDTDRAHRISVTAYAGVAGCVGFYDGFFGPGTGAFYAASLMSLLGYGVLRATAHTKILNVTSNCAALIMMIAGGHVIWRLGICLAAANMIGNYLGSHMAMRLGAKLIRPLLIVMSIAMSLKLLLSHDSPAMRWLQHW